jgi:signal transduction histidine kinase
MSEVIWTINSQRDTMRDFATYVCKYAETFLQVTAIQCRFDLEEEIPDLHFDLGGRRNLFLAVKEAINNAVRHSGASEMVLRIHRQKNEIVVRIEDNGKGFDPELADQQGNGLINMRKRVGEGGGVCSIASRPGGGCCVTLAVPLVCPAKGPADWLAQLWKRNWSSKSKPVSNAPGISQTSV